jgi:hypothetical protein
MEYNKELPQKHLSIRVPWHDNQWNGTICNAPKNNGACLILKNCSKNRDDEKESRLRGTSIDKLAEKDFPVCVGERATFMAPFDFQKTLNHPYASNSKETHGRLKPTKVTFPKYSAAAVPYNWMLKENAERLSKDYDLDYNETREPVMKWKDAWVQQSDNQKALLNTFFGHLKEESSLVFFYAKEVPFVESRRRVLIGAGRINKIIESKKYDGSDSQFGAAYWEHMILHSIRTDNKNGFLLPYNESLTYQKDHPDFNPEDIAVIVPNDKQFEFSYAAEHVSNDAAIRVLTDCIKSLEKSQELQIGKNLNVAISWIQDEIANLEELRGLYPGMGSALQAFGAEKGHFAASAVINKLNNSAKNPWLLLENCFDDTDDFSKGIQQLIPESVRNLYKDLKQRESERLDLMYLLSRFDMTKKQTEYIYVQEKREAISKKRKDGDYLKNPYLIFEDLRLYNDAVALNTIDLGLYSKIKCDHSLPNNLKYQDPFDSGRIRAIVINQLENAALYGHTLQSRKNLVNEIRELPLVPTCPINGDYLRLAENSFEDRIKIVAMADDSSAYQLDKFEQCKQVISSKIEKRIKATRLDITCDWKKLLNQELDKNNVEQIEIDPKEKKAREEKVASLKELAASRFSVLIGPAGTGKTTLLAVLASQPEILGNGVLLLAPTGKARVRVQEMAKDINVTTKTLAQFLSKYNRYDGVTFQYRFSDRKCEAKYETVILDEASMLTEMMLATTLECLKGAKRIILVGDHRQLPPIGAGRPFIDIINFLRTSEIANTFPRITTGYAELTIKRRQGGSNREDLQLAEWFGDGEMEPGADAILNKIITQAGSKYLRVEKWKNESDFESLLKKVIIEELELEDITDVKGFNKTIGANEEGYFNRGDAAKRIEEWQLLTPINDKIFGRVMLNRRIHEWFRSVAIEKVNDFRSKLPPPYGPDQIVYGDKVINVSNTRRNPKYVFPRNDKALNYIANGEIGVVTGWLKSKGKMGRSNLAVEFSTQLGYQYSFFKNEFGEEKLPPLDLAYALTIHKSQGSQFGKVILVIPNPCLLLSKELLYTALTRQKDKVIVLFQGDVFDIKELASPVNSDALKRITNLFRNPDIVEVKGNYLEKNLIHQATDGTLVRSKSELIIYQRLLDKGLDVRYEEKLVINDIEKLPDFTIENDDTGEVFYWEHCGMLHDTDYLARWEEKKQWYFDNGIKPLNNGGGSKGTLIISQDNLQTLSDGSFRGSISVKEIDELINEAF